MSRLEAVDMWRLKTGDSEDYITYDDREWVPASPTSTYSDDTLILLLYGDDAKIMRFADFDSWCNSTDGVVFL